MPRADAERAAIGEHLERCCASGVQVDGIFGELIRAGRSAMHCDLRPLLGSLGLLNAQASLWGFAAVVPEGNDAYRPALAEEQGQSALIVPVFDGCGLADLVAEGLHSRGLLRRLGVATLLGTEQVVRARETGDPLMIFGSALAWLRGYSLGAVIVDWDAAGYELDGIEAILCHPSIAARLHAATRHCWPRPAIGIPGKNIRHAA